MVVTTGPLEGLNEDEIVSRFQAWAHHMAYVWGGYDNTEHEDLAQEALIGVWQALKSYEPNKGALASYLAQGGKMQLNECLRRDKWTGSPSLRGFNKVRTKPPVPIADDDPFFDRQLSGDFSPDVDLLVSMQTLVEQLPLEHQKYVYLRFWLDMAPKDIEDYLDVNGRHAWKLVREALKDELQN